MNAASSRSLTRRLPELAFKILTRPVDRLRHVSLDARYILRYFASAARISSQRRNVIHVTLRKMGTKTDFEPQDIAAPLTTCATFLVLSLSDGPNAAPTVRSTLAGIADISKNVRVRDLNAFFSCNVGIGGVGWDKIVGAPRPKELHQFEEIKGKTHTAPSTPGDLFFHIRSNRRDLCFEFENQLLRNLGDSVTLLDETTGFRYFDARDLLGFVDGTANPVGSAVTPSIMVSEEDASFAGGSYVVVQKYLHDINAWRLLSTEQQEAIIGRTKADNIELDDADDGKQQAHKTLATVEDADGVEHDILRDNMPFGSPARGEWGTYFVGYSKNLWVTETMLRRMFIGHPPGLHDRILDYSRAVTGSVFFVPSASFLATLG